MLNLCEVVESTLKKCFVWENDQQNISDILQKFEKFAILFLKSSRKHVALVEEWLGMKI